MQQVSGVAALIELSVCCVCVCAQKNRQILYSPGEIEKIVCVNGVCVCVCVCVCVRCLRPKSTVGLFLSGQFGTKGTGKGGKEGWRL